MFLLLLLLFSPSFFSSKGKKKFASLRGINDGMSIRRRFNDEFSFNFWDEGMFLRPSIMGEDGG